MNVFDLAAKLTLDSSEFDKGLGKAKSMASTIGGGIASVAKVGMTAVTAATAAMGAFAAKSVSTGAEFDKSMSQVAATMGLTMDEMANQTGEVDLAWGKFTGNLRDYAQEMGRNTAFSATEAADALNYMALAGYDVQTSMEMLPNVLNLAAAGDMDLARASDMVTDTQTAFGISLERTSQMVDEMAKAASTGNTSVEQLGDAFLVVGGLAKELNGGMVTLADGTKKPVDGVQELEIALTAMANAGVKGSEAGTHMRNMLLKLSSPTDDGVAQMKALGVSVFDAGGQMRSLQDIMGDLSGSLDNLTQEEKIQAISDLFNTRDMASAEALLAAVGQDWNEIGESILNAEGAAQKMADTQLDNLAGDITLFKSALEGAQIAVSDGLTPSLREFVQFGTKGLSELTEAFKEGGLSGAMEKFGELLSEGIAMVTEKLPEMVDAGMQLLGALGQGIADNAPQLLSAFEQIGSMVLQNVAVLMNKIADSITNTDWSQLGTDIANKLTSIFDFENGSLGSILTAGAKIVEGLVKGIGEAAPTLLPAAMDIITSFIEFLMNNLPSILNAAVDLVIGLAEGLTNPTSLSNMLTSALELIVTLTKGLIDNIPKIVAALPKIIENIVQTLIKLAPKLVTSAIQIMFQLQMGLIKAIPSLLQAIPEIIGSLVAGCIEYAPEMLKAGKECIDEMKEGIESLNPAEWGSDLIDKLVQGIRNAFGRLKSAVDSAASIIRSYLHFSVPDVGPLADFSSYAPDMMKLFAKGIRDNENIVKAQIGKSFDFSDMSEYSASTISSGGSVDLSAIVALLNTYLPQISNMQMVTDTGMLVGALAPAMNDTLGSIKTRNDKR